MLFRGVTTLLVSLFTFAGFLTAFPPSAPQWDAQRSLERLVALGHLWGYAKYHHPALAFADIDWDAALLSALPRVRDARDSAQFEAALGEMLAVLGDVATRIHRKTETSSIAAGGGTHLAFEMAEDGVLVVHLGDYYLLQSPLSQSNLQAALALLPSAKGLVVDARSEGEVDAFGKFWLSATVAQLAGMISTVRVSLPGELHRVFYGFPSGSVFSSGQYRGGLFTRSGQSIRPATKARDIPCVFLLGRFAAPEAAVPLQALGRALIVLEGDPSTTFYGGTHSIDLGEGLVAEVRENEPVLADGTSARPVPDLVVSPDGADSGEAGLKAAATLVRNFQPSKVGRTRLPATVEAPRERSYPDLATPPLEYRLLSLYRLWNVIRFFYPYHRLAERSWETVLPELIPQFEEATDATTYARAVAELARRIQDSHAYVAGGAYTKQLVPPGYPPIRVRVVEGLPVVVARFGEEAAAAGVEVGDVVVRVDGEPATTRIARFAALISASTPQSLNDKASLSFMNGPPDSSVQLVLRGSDGKERTVALTRRYEDFTTLYHRERSGEVVQLLPGNIGYVDLDRLTIEMVDDMFNQLRETQAIVFDMRGYPNGTVWAIAPRLTSEQPEVALFETALVGHGSPQDSSGTVFEEFRQRVNPTPAGQWLYTGRTVMLMDGRTASQGEHTGLYLRAANGTRFVGSPTAGADGEIATVPLPGGLVVGFTGQSVRFPDGTDIQRVGLKPDLMVTPTIRGIREGRDEVLEAALLLLR